MRKLLVVTLVGALLGAALPGAALAGGRGYGGYSGGHGGYYGGHGGGGCPGPSSGGLALGAAAIVTAPFWRCPHGRVCPTRRVRPAARVCSPTDVRPVTDGMRRRRRPTASTELCAATGGHGPAGDHLFKRAARARRRWRAPAVAVVWVPSASPPPPPPPSPVPNQCCPTFDCPPVRDRVVRSTRSPVPRPHRHGKMPWEILDPGTY